MRVVISERTYLSYCPGIEHPIGRNLVLMIRSHDGTPEFIQPLDASLGSSTERGTTKLNTLNSENHRKLVFICYAIDSYLSSKFAIFFKAVPQGTSKSSLKEDISVSNVFRLRYSTAASLMASAFLSGQLKCFRTARSSAYQTNNNLKLCYLNNTIYQKQP